MRLIDADALMELIKKEQSRFENAGYDEWCNGIYLGLDKAIDEIDDAPTVDAVPVVHGMWIAVPSSDMMTGKAYKCSECQKMRYGSFMPNYCQICGAKMDGEKDG